jgi:hypothetical protein
MFSFAFAKEGTKAACGKAGKSTPAMIYRHCLPIITGIE